MKKKKRTAYRSSSNQLQYTALAIISFTVVVAEVLLISQHQFMKNWTECLLNVCIVADDTGLLCAEMHVMLTWKRTYYGDWGWLVSM